jgi:hypothetical protein
MRRARRAPQAAVLLVLVCSGALPVRAEEAPAPETRAEELRRLRLGNKPQPPRPPLLERLMAGGAGGSSLPFLAVGFHDFSLRPGSQRSGGGLSLIADYWNPERADSALGVFASAAVSVTGYQIDDLRVGRIPHDSDHRPPDSTQLADLQPFAPRLSEYGVGHRSRYVFLEMRRRELTRERFFGAGPDARLSDETSFRLGDLSYELVGISRLAGPMAGAVRVGGLTAEVGPGERKGVPSIERVFDDRDAPGLAKQPHMLHAAAELLVDWRDHARNAHRGGAVSLAAERYLDPDGAFSFNRLALDARHVWTLGSRQRVFALRGYSSLARPDAGSRVPFYLQDTLGGPRTLRGFADFRFRAPAAALVSAEYRWEAIPALELAVFEDAGRVGDGLSDLSHGKLRTSSGAGLRLKRADAVLFRLDVAKSPEELRVVAATSFSF